MSNSPFIYNGILNIQPSLNLEEIQKVAGSRQPSLNLEEIQKVAGSCQSINEKYIHIESLLATHFEEHNIELCAHPYIRPYNKNGIIEKNKLFFSIPFDNYCSIELFEKECIKLLHLIEKLGEFKIINGYINAVQIFGIEEPIQYKYIIKIKEASNKIVLSKIVYDRNIYNKMKSYLKSSSKENADFFHSLK